MNRQFTVPDSENNKENPGAPVELRPDDLEKASGAGCTDNPENKRRKLEEGKQ